MAEKSEEVLRKLSRHDFFFETPLYEVVDEDELIEEIYTGEVDAYSSKYKSPTTYTISYESMTTGYSAYDGFKKVVLTNKRKSDDKLYFFLFTNDDKYIKVGQLPTLANLQYTELDENYSKYVDESELSLLKKAIGLASHGVGAGSFVYLRKIFEKQISEAYEKNKAEIGVTKAEFDKKRMTDKVTVLSDYLPSQLVEMKEIYGILSNGVHEMKESECLQYFGPMRLSVELIMQQKVEIEIKKEKDAQVRKQIAQIQQSLKSQ